MRLDEKIRFGVDREPLTGASSLLVEARVAMGRGTYERVATLLETLADLPTTGDRQDQTSFLVADAIVRRANGRHTEAVASGRQAFELSRGQAQIHYGTEGFVEAVEAAFDAGDVDGAADLLAAIDSLEPIEHRPFLDAQVARLRARVAATSPNGATEDLFTEAIAGFRRIDARFWVAVSLLEHGEWLAGRGRDDADARIAESMTMFEELGAAPWLERSVRARETSATASHDST